MEENFNEVVRPEYAQVLFLYYFSVLYGYLPGRNKQLSP